MNFNITCVPHTSHRNALYTLKSPTNYQIENKENIIVTDIFQPNCSRTNEGDKGNLIGYAVKRLASIIVGVYCEFLTEYRIYDKV